MNRYICHKCGCSYRGDYKIHLEVCGGITDDELEGDLEDIIEEQEDYIEDQREDDDIYLYETD